MKKLESWIKKRIERKTLLWGILRFCKYLVTFDAKALSLLIRRDIFRNSIFIYQDELWMASLFPKEILDKIIELFRPKSILDIGCGVGVSLDYFISKGINAAGIEGSQIAISRARHPRLIIRHNLEKELNLNKKFDLIWSFEFVEHIQPKFVDNLLKIFSNHSDKIVMSAAGPEQGGDGHLNEQPKIYWIKQFEKYGYKFNNDKAEELSKIDAPYSKNMLVFER